MAGTTIRTYVSNAFVEHKIVPDILDSPPTKFLHVKFNASGKEVDLGNELTTYEVSKAPEIHFENESNDLHTMIFLDPDAPSRNWSFLRSVKHWVITNISGSNVSSGQKLGEFLPSGPPLWSGLHRYVFLVYKQPGVLDVKDPGKLRFNLREFTKLHGLGDPVYGNFYQARFRWRN